MFEHYLKDLHSLHLYIGKYKLIETVAGEGFVLNKKEYLFEITPQEQTICFDIQLADYQNERQKLEIEVLKNVNDDYSEGRRISLYMDGDTLCTKNPMKRQDLNPFNSKATGPF